MLAASVVASVVASAFGALPALAQAAPQVKFSTTAGDFVIEVYPDKAPRTVENFLQYVKDKHYNGTIFHRMIPTFMVQGGGFDASYVQKKNRAPVAHEGQEALAKGGARNVVGTVAMARTNDPNSATSQFFINVADNEFLNFKAPTASGWGYAVFGKVIAGLDIVDKIRAVKTGRKGFHDDVPVQDVVLAKATAL